jgi:dihydrofolate reductase
MRKLKLQVQISIDGFIADKNGKTNWLLWKDWDRQWNWDDELKKYFNEIFESIDCILLSRKMAEGGFIDHWTAAAKEPDDPRFEYAKKINATHKIVFTKKPDEPKWNNVDILGADLTGEINRLKNQRGKDIIVYGGATFVSSLIKARLIDEFQLFINPTILGNGLPIFEGLESMQDLALVESKSFDCGMAVLIYEPKKSSNYSK